MSVVCTIECDREASILRRPWPTRASCAIGGGGGGSPFQEKQYRSVQVCDCQIIFGQLECRNLYSHPYPPMYLDNYFRLTCYLGRAIAQAVRRRAPNAEDRVRSRVSPCEICGGQSGSGTIFFPNTSVFPCQFHSTGTPLLGKDKG
jgi:hypothetical protein